MAEELQITDFDYDLPPELIAQQPCEPRDQARLLLLPPPAAPWEHRQVSDLPELLRPGDLLVMNDSLVVPARLRGRRTATGGKWEGLFLQAHAEGTWELLSQTRGQLRSGETLEVLPPPANAALPPLPLLVLGRTPERHLLVQPQARGDALALLQRYGQTPIPPYIRRGQAVTADQNHYQTIFARVPGSVAAPTAGLHFTADLLRRLDERGISRATVTLHVGIGTFAPLRPENLATGTLHQEWCAVPDATAAAIATARQRGGRIVAVGTTTTRTLETWAQQGSPPDWTGQTQLFIRPGFGFQVVDGLMTNFHLPRSSLLMLVAALVGRQRLLDAYAEAVRCRYRFYSYGDAMLVWRGADS